MFENFFDIKILFCHEDQLCSEGAEEMGIVELDTNTLPTHGTSRKPVRLCTLYTMYTSTFKSEFGRLPGVKNGF